MNNCQSCADYLAQIHAMNMKQVKDILISWVVTVPISAVFAIGIFWVMQGFL